VLAGEGWLSISLMALSEVLLFSPLLPRRVYGFYLDSGICRVHHSA